MAGKTKDMSQIKQLLLLKKEGVSNRKAAATVGINKDKSNVEGSVRLIYTRFFAELRNETFYSIDALNAAAAEKMPKHNQKRMQKNPYTHEERLFAIDRPNLKPLLEADFEIVSYADLKVSSNCCVYLGRDQHYYTVPYQHISKTTHVAYSRSLVKIYVNGELVATHFPPE